MFQAAAWLIATFYQWTHNHAIAIALVSVAIMLLITPLTLKSTKGMLEMQRLQPEMKKLQAQYKGDRQRLNEEMMKLYQEHKVNPLASCLPLLAQMPVFIIMFRVLHGITKVGADGKSFDPQYISKTTELYKALNGATHMKSFGLDLAISPAEAVQDSFTKGIPYVLLIVLLAGMFLVQQRMIANRAAAPTMSAGQAKFMQYLPVAFAIFQVFLPTSLVIYYMTQAVIRIVQQWYITKRFYGHDESIGRQAQAASARAKVVDTKVVEKKEKKDESSGKPIASRRVTAPKNRPTPQGRPTPPSRRGKRDNG